MRLAHLVLLACMPVVAWAGNAIDMVFSEVSIYSLPHIVVKHEFQIADQGVVVVDCNDPALRAAYKMVDHSHGTNVDSHVDYLVYEDCGYPLRDREDWMLVHESNTVTSNVPSDARAAKEKLFDAHGEKFFEVQLDASRPVKRIKVVAHAKLYNPVESVLIRKPLQTTEAEESRVFYVALRPRWGSVQHEDTALIRQFRQLVVLRDELVRWRDFAARMLVANRSLKDINEYTSEDLVAVLKAPVKPREDLDQISAELLADASRASGRPPEKIDALGKQLLGVTRLSFAYPQIHASLAERTPGLIADAGSMRNLLIAGGRLLDEGGGVRRQLERTIGQIDMVLKAMVYLWGPNDLGEFRAMLAGLDRAAKGAVDDAARLVTFLDNELGREPNTGNWMAIETSQLYRKRWPTEAAPDSPRGSMLLRGLFSDLLYLTMEARFNLEIAGAWSREAGARIKQLAERAAQMAPDPDLAYPPGLFIDPGQTAATIEPGQVASFAIRVENRTTVEREMRALEADSPPDGWHTRVQPENARLKPGEGVTVHYALGAPYYGHEPINHVSTLKIGWQDEPGLVHQPQFLTRLRVAGKMAELPGPGARRNPPLFSAHGTDDAQLGASRVIGRGENRRLEVEQQGDGLLVSTDGEERLFMEPGGVSRYTVKVIHKGAGPRRVSVKLMTPVPERWIVAVDPEEVECRPEVLQRFNMRITAPIDTIAAKQVELLLGIGYTDEFTRVDKVAFRRVTVALDVVRSKPLINGGEVRTYRARTGASTSLMMELSNIGTVDDTFDLVVDHKPADWYVHLDRTSARVPHKSNPVLVPITVRPPLGALSGEFEKIAIRAISIGHPEIMTRQQLTVAVKAPDNFALEPMRPRYLVAPGTEGRIEFRARNVMDHPVRLAWKVSPRTVHPEWVSLDEPLTELGPDQEVVLGMRVGIPHGIPLDRSFPVGIMALDEHGGEIVSAGVEVRTIPLHRIEMVALEDQIVRTRTLLMIPLEVTNHGAEADDVGMIIEGKRRYWARLSHRKLFLRPGQTYLVTLTVRIPVEAQADQSADLLVQATSLKDGGARDFVRIGVAPPYVIRTNASTYGARTKF